MNNPIKNKQRTDRAAKNWRAKIEAQQVSGQEPGSFCRQRSICSSGFYAWRKRLGMKESATNSVVRGQQLLPAPQRPVSGAGFLRLDSAGAAVLKNPVIKQNPRVIWVETPDGYRVAINGDIWLAEVFGLLKAL